MGSGALLLQCLGCERQGDFCGVKRHPHHPCLWFLKETARSSMNFLPYHDLQQFSYHQNSPKWGKFWNIFRNKTWRASASEPQSMDDLGHGYLASWLPILSHFQTPGNRELWFSWHGPTVRLFLGIDEGCQVPYFKTNFKAFSVAASRAKQFQSKDLIFINWVKEHSTVAKAVAYVNLFI